MKTILEKLSRSRDLAISVLVHVVILLILALAVFRVVQPPEPDEYNPGPEVLTPSTAEKPPENRARDPLADASKLLQNQSPATPPVTPVITTIRPLDDLVAPSPGIGGPGSVPVSRESTPIQKGPAPDLDANRIPRDALPGIAQMTKSWKRPGGDKYEFTAVLAKYKDGDWNSTVRVQNNRVTGGSLPNLLYLMNKWSKDRIQTNEDKVEVVSLDDGEILAKCPPFVFMTGTRDFRLTDNEVENLRKYLRMGGCIWGDSSVPGRRSRFDVAFKREMKRVIGNIDAEFEPLPTDHRIFREAYFPQVTAVPAGLNYYREPVTAMKLFGEVAIIYTANDYADLWQIGLNGKGEVDLRRNQQGQYVAVNPEIWDHRSSYLGNVTPVEKGRDSAANLADTYRFGANVIFHLLTRWDEKLGAAGTL